MPRQKMISGLALLLTAGYVTFVLLAPAGVTKPITQALVVGLLLACLGATLRAVHRARRAAHRTQPRPRTPTAALPTHPVNGTPCLVPIPFTSESAMPDPITPAEAAAVTAEAATHLDHLQEALQSLGLHARLLTQDDRLPRLRVINPKATTLTEIISVVQRHDRWLFLWSWNEPITEVAQLATAAERIRYVLAATSPSAA
ncbi:hypothetical protein ACFPZ3_52645 [Nonomuraea insulae]|uniref:Uncharacterized protein n=2 Tax=Nonomuraea insulae TaxID=1616787 RepID=A0ABW1D5S5_9ACTN